MIDPFSTFLGVVLGTTSLALWLEFLDRWRTRHDELWSESSWDFRPAGASNQIPLGAHDDLTTNHDAGTASTIVRPPGWTSADELRSIRAIFEEDKR